LDSQKVWEWNLKGTDGLSCQECGMTMTLRGRAKEPIIMFFSFSFILVPHPKKHDGSMARALLLLVVIWGPWQV